MSPSPTPGPSSWKDDLNIRYKRNPLNLETMEYVLNFITYLIYINRLLVKKPEKSQNKGGRLIEYGFKGHGKSNIYALYFTKF